MQRPAAYLAADARQRLRTGSGLEAVRENASVRLHPHDLSGSKLEAEKVKVDVGEVASPVHILAVDDFRFLRMQHQLAGRKAVHNRTPKCPRLLGAPAVTNGIVRAPVERDMRKGSHHPHVERIMQEHVRQERAGIEDNGVVALDSANLAKDLEREFRITIAKSEQIEIARRAMRIVE